MTIQGNVLPFPGEKRAAPTSTPGEPVIGHKARFVWERALRAGDPPRHVKGFLLLLGTYMDDDGTKARPSTATLCEQFDLSRQRVFELLKEAETTGWLITINRPGKPSERRPSTPIPPSVTRQTGLTGDPSDPSDGSDPEMYNPTYNPSDPSDDTRQTHLTGTADPSDPSDPTEEIQADRPNTDGGTLPPNPLRLAAPPAPRTDQPTQDPHVPQHATQVRNPTPDRAHARRAHRQRRRHAK